MARGDSELDELRNYIHECFANAKRNCQHALFSFLSYREVDVGYTVVVFVLQSAPKVLAILILQPSQLFNLGLTSRKKLSGVDVCPLPW